MWHGRAWRVLRSSPQGDAWVRTAHGVGELLLSLLSEAFSLGTTAMDERIVAIHQAWRKISSVKGGFVALARKAALARTRKPRVHAIVG